MICVLTALFCCSPPLLSDLGSVFRGSSNHVSDALHRTLPLLPLCAPLKLYKTPPSQHSPWTTNAAPRSPSICQLPQEAIRTLAPVAPVVLVELYLVSACSRGWSRPRHASTRAARRVGELMDKIEVVPQRTRSEFCISSTSGAGLEAGKARLCTNAKSLRVAAGRRFLAFLGKRERNQWPKNRATASQRTPFTWRAAHRTRGPLLEECRSSCVERSWSRYRVGR